MMDTGTILIEAPHVSPAPAHGGLRQEAGRPARADAAGRDPGVWAAIVAGLLAGMDGGLCLVLPWLVHRLLGASPLSPELRGLTVLNALLTVLFAALQGGYGPRVLPRPGPQMRTTLAGAVTAQLVVGAAIALLPGVRVAEPGWLMLAAPATLAGLTAARAFAGTLIARRAGRLAQRTVLIGNARDAARLQRALTRRRGEPLRLLGLLGQRGSAGPMPWLGAPETVFALIREGAVDHVVVALPRTGAGRLLSLLQELADHPVRISLLPAPLGALLGAAAPRQLPPPLIPLADRPVSGWNGVVKRTEDLLIGGLAVALFAPLMALIAIAIRLDSPGPVLFRQRRIGFSNRSFEILKFRTMHAGAGAPPGALRQARRGDARVTRVGALLRRTSLDELPQLFNVLRGEMSLVGPRPHAPGTCAAGRPFERAVARYAARHRVRPGITGLAQVRGWRGETDTTEKLVRRLESDLDYVESWSLWLDLAILVRSVGAVLRMTNAC